MSDDQDETTRDPADPSDESRAHARDSDAEDEAGDSTPETFDELWERLSDAQQEYVLARQKYRFKNDAAESCSLHPSTVYDWPDYVEEAVRMLRNHRRDAIQQGMQEAATRAVQRLKEILDEEEDDLRSVMKAIQLSIEQEVGKATQKQEIEHSAPGVDSDSLDAAKDAVTDTVEGLFGDDGEDGED